MVEGSQVFGCVIGETIIERSRLDFSTQVRIAQVVMSSPNATSCCPDNITTVTTADSGLMSRCGSVQLFLMTTPIESILTDQVTNLHSHLMLERRTRIGRLVWQITFTILSILLGFFY